MNRANASFALLVAPLCIGLSACTEQRIQVDNLPPTAEFQSPNAEDALLFQGIPETFRGHVQDPDGLPEELTATFLSGDQELCPPAAPSANGEIFCDITLPAGPTELRLAVVDRGGLSGFDVDTFWARPSAEPTAEIFQPLSADQFFADQIITFEGSVDDIEDAPEDLRVWWSSNLEPGLSDAVDATPNANGTVNGVGFLPEGDHQVRLNVEDRAGNISFDATVIRVGPANRPPECGEITEPFSGSVHRFGSTLTFVASVSDPDVPNNFIDIAWSSDQDGDLAESTPGSDGSITYFNSDLSTNTHVITMTAVDAFGQSCTSSIIVIIGSPPTIDVTSPQRNAVYQADTLMEFSATVSDPDGPDTDLTVTWVDDSAADPFLVVSPGLDGTTSDLRTRDAGTYLLTVTVSDVSGLETQVQIPYSVNALPGGPGIEVGPDSPDTNDDITVTVTTPSVDPDDDDVTYSYEWHLNGVVQFGETGPTVPSSSTTRGDVWTAYVTPTDGFGEGPTASDSITVGNTPPAPGTVEIQGGPFFESSTVTCHASLGTDADGDDVTYLYSWQVNTNSIPVNTSTLTGDWFSRDDVVHCTATPTDGFSQGESATSGDVTILNTPPQVADVTINPSAPEATDTVECLWNFTDADNDTPQSVVTWSVNSIPAGTGATLEAVVTTDDVITCEVTANDGDVDGNSLTANATVVESAPSIDSVDVRPNVANAATPLTCEYTGFTDPQGEADESRYAWTVNGSPVSTSSSISTGYAKGDVVVCTVTPSDGSFDGAPLSDSVTIQNSPPTGPILEIDPEFPLAGLDDLVCSLQTRATDPDGDPVSYTFSWTVNGVPFFGALNEAESSTVAGAEFGGLETWECTATPSDGEDTGPTDSASVFTLPSINPKVATGSTHSCKLDRRGEVACWGLNQLGRLDVPGELFLDVDAGFEYTCGITQDSTLRCWGVATTPGEQFFPPTGEYTAVGAGIRFACATTGNDGIVCWGDSNDSDGVIANAPTTGQFTAVSVGERHVCAVRDSGALLCWGNNGQNQVTGRTSLPRPTGSVQSVTAGWLHNCAILLDGTAQCWGNNFGGRATPPIGDEFISIGAGVVHSCGIRADGSGTCWGFDTGGRATPPTVDSDGNAIVFVSTDVTNHSCGIESNGRAFCWGPNDDGQASPP